MNWREEEMLMDREERVHAEGYARGAASAADRIAALEARLAEIEPIAASMGDPSRTSKFEYGVRKKNDEQRTLHTYPTAIQAVEYLAEMNEVVPQFDADEWEIVVRTITTTAWKKAEHEQQA